MKKLRSDYKRIKDKRGKTGEGRYPEWDYFDPIDAVVLGHKPATKLTVTIDTLKEDSPGIDEVAAGDRFTPESEIGTSSVMSHSTEAPEESGSTIKKETQTVKSRNNCY